MNKHTPICLADLATTFHLLKPADSDTRRAIAALLNFEPATPIATSPAKVEQARSFPKPVVPTSSQGPTPVTPSLSQPEKPSSDQIQRLQPAHAELNLEAELVLSPTDATPIGDTQKPTWWINVQKLDVYAKTASRPTPAPRPLFRAEWRRTTIAGSVSVMAPEGRIDVDRLTDILARQEVPETIPRFPRPTMRRGLQILIDISQPMEPFREDQRQMVRYLRDLVGSEFFEVFQFRGTPDREAQLVTTRRAVTSYTPAPPGTPVLALTDLGIGALSAGSAYIPPAEWLAFARRLHGEGCLPIALVPYGPGRWPALLRGIMRLVHWHHTGERQAGSVPMSPQVEGSDEIKELVLRLYQRNPQAIVLSSLVSLASRVEFSLLRRMRLALAPDADGGAEADLWFSSLVQERGATAILLRPDVAESLRKALHKETPDLFELAWRELDDYREETRAFSGTRLEEKINYLEARDGASAKGEIQTLLRRVIRTLVEQESDEDGLALWSLEVLNSLPQTVRASKASRDLSLAAGMRLDLPGVAPNTVPNDLLGKRWLLPVGVSDLPKTSVGVRLTPQGLVFSEPAEPDAKIIDNVPRTIPRTLWLRWGKKATQRRPVSITPGQPTTPIPMSDLGNGPIFVDLLNGAQWKLQVQARSKEATATADRAQVETLDRSARNLESLPDEVFSYPNLKELDLSGNRLEALPPEIGRLTTLKKLILDGNRLKKLPDEISALLSLKELSVVGSRLESVPATIGKLQNLRHLDLRDNRLTALPDSLRKLTNLETLDLRGNPLPVPANVLERIAEPEAILETLSQQASGPTHTDNQSLRSRIDQMRTQAAARSSEWEVIVDRIQQGRCVPIIGGWLDFEYAVGMSEEQLSAAYAQFIEYPLPIPYRLEQLIEYQRTNTSRGWLDVNLDFLDFVKNVIYETARRADMSIDALYEAKAQFDQLNVTEFARRLGYPSFQRGREDPLVLLANLNLPIYITTSYFCFLEFALRQAGKSPRTESYSPEEEAHLASEFQPDPNYTPTVTEPLVYHVFGVDRTPSTLVISEDDYLSYLMEVTRNTDLIPPMVRRPLADSTLLFLGHALDELRWRVLDHAILRRRSARLKLVSVFQLGPDEKVNLVDTHLRRSGFIPFSGTPGALLEEIWIRVKNA